MFNWLKRRIERHNEQSRARAEAYARAAQEIRRASEEAAERLRKGDPSAIQWTEFSDEDAPQK